MDEKDEATLVRLAKSGDAAAFDTLVVRYLPDIYRFTLRYLGDQDRAEDATQETFLKAWRNLWRFNADKPLRPWLFRIAKNAAVDQTRGKAALPFSFFARNDAEPFEETIADEEPLPDEIIAGAEDAAAVAQALGALSARDRRILLLRYDADLSFEDIARIERLPAASVRSVHRRALGKLRTLLDATERDLGT